MTITLIPGDGIGPEVTRAVVRILEAAGFAPTWESFSAGAGAVEEHGTTLPEPLLASIKKNKIALKGPMGNIPAFRRKIQALLGDDAARQQLIKELGLSQGEG